MDEMIQVNTERLGEDAEQIYDYIDDIRKMEEEIRSAIETLGNDFEGEAGTAFQEKVGANIETLEQMLTVLNSVYQFENTAKESYETCENTVASLIAEI